MLTLTLLAAMTTGQYQAACPDGQCPTGYYYVVQPQPVVYYQQPVAYYTQPVYYQPQPAPQPVPVQPVSYQVVTEMPPTPRAVPPATPRAAEPTQTAQQQPAAGDPYGFLSWLNSTRAGYGLPAVGYDPNLEAWAQVNNAQQAVRGLGHHAPNYGWWSCAAGPQNPNGMATSFADACASWMSSSPHRAALLNPAARWAGIAGYGAYWTANLR